MTNNFNKAHHIGIVVQDIQASEAWYVEHLGFERLYTFGWPGVKVAFIGRGDLKIELFQNEQAIPMDAERQAAQTNLKIGGINHFALEVEDLDEAVSTLHTNGVEILHRQEMFPTVAGIALPSFTTMSACWLSSFSPRKVRRPALPRPPILPCSCLKRTSCW